LPGLSSLLKRVLAPVETRSEAEPVLPGFETLPELVEPDFAPGRLPGTRPVAVIDIGSNSVRLVVYEGLTRAPTPVFNEKALCGLGRVLASTGRLADDAVAAALAALRRFRALADQLQVEDLYVLATAAARDAANGPDFLAAAERICRSPIDLISGEIEARLTALGIVSGIWRPDGIAGDLGGGSLELVTVKDDVIGRGESLPLGGLRLIDASGGSLKKAERIVRGALETVDLSAGEGRPFYAIGGTWRALARLHIKHANYPLKVMHGYEIPAKDAMEFARLVEKAAPENLEAIEFVSTERRPLLAYGALVLEHVVRAQKASKVVISALGVREGLLYSLLTPEERRLDPLLAAARELALLRSRSPVHARELVEWTDRLFADVDPQETIEERRLRHAACLLADIGWRAHPDYRGEQSVSIIANAAFVGVDHPGRAFLALAVFFRHAGLGDSELSPRLRQLVNPRAFQRARVLGAAMRVAYIISASMRGVLPRTPLRLENETLVLHLERDLADLAADRVANRLRSLAKLVGVSARIATGRD
jgi:exopolyphosphatase/guanosine-5'-triphosphate,3'-diphosphate pyrophosphatase